MRGLLSRTSVTVDEAVAIRLGLITGPIDFEPIDGAEDADADCPMYWLRDDLEDKRDVLEGEYIEAKHEKKPAHVIAEKLAAVQKQEAIIEQANVYLCAIQDELNKGEQSVLKVDSALSNAAYTFITLHSFNEWVKRKDVPGGQRDAAEPVGSLQAGNEVATKPQSRTKLRDQERAILNEIEKRKLDPLALPSAPPGKKGVKSVIRQSLQSSELLKGATTFDKAWERLRKHGFIREA